MSERIAVVDENNRFLRWAERGEVHAEQLPHRSIQIALFDSQGRLDDTDPAYHRYDPSYVTNVPRGGQRFVLLLTW